jgi:hypothetical protein
MVDRDRLSRYSTALVDVIVRGEGDAQTLRQFLEHAPPHINDCVYRRGAPVDTLSEWLFPDDATAQAYFLGNAPNEPPLKNN